VTSSTAIFATKDVVATLAYYKDVLGFDTTWSWGEPVSFGGASIDGVSIMFSLQPELAERIHGHEHWIKVDDPDEQYAKHVERGAKVVSEIANRPWGFREYVVEDLNGYRLRIAGPPRGDVPPSNPFPQEITLHIERPSDDEFERVTHAAFGSKGVGFGETAQSVLDRTWKCVVARLPSGEAIGLLRIMHDAPGWFSIWEVAIVPEWQAKRIGSKIMEEALSLIREVCPGAFGVPLHLQTRFLRAAGLQARKRERASSLGVRSQLHKELPVRQAIVAGEFRLVERDEPEPLIEPNRLPLIRIDAKPHALTSHLIHNRLQ